VDSLLRLFDLICNHRVTLTDQAVAQESSDMIGNEERGRDMGGDSKAAMTTLDHAEKAGPFLNAPDHG